MKKNTLVEQWNWLSDADLASVNVGAGYIEVFDDAKDEFVRHPLLPLYVQIIKHAYERGLAHKPLY